MPAAGETATGDVGDTVVADTPRLKAELSEEDKDFLEEARLAQLMTDDPEAYEQEVIDALENPSPKG